MALGSLHHLDHKLLELLQPGKIVYQEDDSRPGHPAISTVVTETCYPNVYLRRQFHRLGSPHPEYTLAELLPAREVVIFDPNYEQQH